MTREVAPDEFLDLFRQAKTDVFRLELRDRYNVPAERDRWEAWQARDWPRLDELNARDRAVWMQLIRDVTGAGTRVQRVRVVSEPPSDYIQFCLRLNAGNAEAGEDIRYLPRHTAPPLPTVDYWLFDCATAVVLHFADDDSLTRMELITDSDEIDEFCAAADEACRLAVTYPEYAAKWADLAEPPPGA